jgi:hypothetical protein
VECRGMDGMLPGNVQVVYRLKSAWSGWALRGMELEWTLVLFFLRSPFIFWILKWTFQEW